VRFVERVVEKVIVRHDPQCLEKLEQARQLIAAASERLTCQSAESEAPLVLEGASPSGSFPTMAEMERAMILAAYQRSNRKPLEAARDRKDDSLPQTARDGLRGSMTLPSHWQHSDRDCSQASSALQEDQQVQRGRFGLIRQSKSSVSDGLLLSPSESCRSIPPLGDIWRRYLGRHINSARPLLTFAASRSPNLSHMRLPVIFRNLFIERNAFSLSGLTVCGSMRLDMIPLSEMSTPSISSVN